MLKAVEYLLDRVGQAIAEEKIIEELGKKGVDKDEAKSALSNSFNNGGYTLKVKDPDDKKNYHFIPKEKKDIQELSSLLLNTKDRKKRDKLILDFYLNKIKSPAASNLKQQANSSRPSQEASIEWIEWKAEIEADEDYLKALKSKPNQEMEVIKWECKIKRKKDILQSL